MVPTAARKWGEEKMEAPVKAAFGHQGIYRFFSAPLPCACNNSVQAWTRAVLPESLVSGRTAFCKGGRAGGYSGWASVLGIQTGVFWKVLA